jgi:hypothetical protein
MPPLSQPDNQPKPEILLRRVVAQLGRHALWDASLVFVPPLAALIYILAYLNRVAWVGSSTLILLAGVAAGLGALAVLLRYRPLIPSLSGAARLVDQRSEAMDRFLTLATIDAGRIAPPLVERLRAEASRFGEKVTLKKDFPYRPKRSAYWSLGGSLMAVILFHLWFPWAAPAILPAAAPRQLLRELAEQMTRKPGLSELAQELKALAKKLEDPGISQQQKKELIQEIEKRIEQQQKKEEEKDKRDLLGQAAGAAKGLEKEQLASGQDHQKSEQKGGGIQTNLSQEGQGKNKQSQGGSGEGKGDAKPEPSQDQPGKSAQGNPQEPGPEKSQQQGEAKNQRPDPHQPGKEQGQETLAKNRGGSQEGSGKTPSEEPKGAPPAERFYKPGEGPEGLRGARYVTVQLPEELIADSKGEARPSKPSKGARARSQVPVSNVPLPSRVPDAPTEKQPMPIEYRGVIR